MHPPSQNAPRHDFAPRSAPAAFGALTPTPGRALGDAGNFRPRAAMRGVLMPRPGPILCCYFGARTSGDHLIGQNVLEI
jgi:hypothetical protein